VDPGEVGTVVVTPLDRRAQPYVRFELNDRMELGDRDCPCGRTLRFAPGGVLGRADDLTKINGVLFAPTAVEDVVRSTDAVADEFRLYIEPHERKDIDVPRLVVERAPDAGGADSRDGAVLEELGKELKQTTNLTFDVELREHGSLERFDLKADRVEDRR
jgi:phenylacetate-CoA ligase